MRNGITVRDVMNREFVGVSEADSLADAAELMRAEPAEAVVVLRGSEPIGSLSTATAMAAMLDGDPHEQTVGEVMEPPVPTVRPETALSDAAQHLIARGTSHLFVVDDGVVGLVTERDVLAASETVETARSAGGEGETIEPEALDSESIETEGSIQSVCEVCGSLTPELSAVNGQLVCQDCRAH